MNTFLTTNTKSNFLIAPTLKGGANHLRFFFSKSEVVSLLESAGLSRSNPYYIVQQGQVDFIIRPPSCPPHTNAYYVSGLAATVDQDEKPRAA